MHDIGVIALNHSYLGSLGAMLDAHALIQELFVSNDILGHYARMQTALRIASLTGRPAELAGGRHFQVDTGIAGLKSLRIVFLPSFQVAVPELIGTVMEDSSILHEWLRIQAKSDALIGGCGASVFHLAAAGLLNDQEASVPDRLAEIFRMMFPRVQIAPHEGSCTTGAVMSCGSGHLAQSFVIAMIAKSIAPETAQWLALRQGLDKSDSEHPDDPLIKRAQIWIRERFTHQFKIGDLAKHLSVSHQTLIRRFERTMNETPRSYAQRIRSETAASMLRETRRPISEISQLVGYADIKSFRQVFSNHMGMPPASYRASFRAE